MCGQDDPVIVNTKDAVRTITLNDPDRQNPLTIPAKEALIDALDGVDEIGVRCVVLEGAGDAFCSGGDVVLMADHAGGGGDADVIGHTHRLSNEIVRRIVALPVPVVMKIDGPAVGGGAGIALAGDLRLASDQARIGFPFAQVGLCLDDGVSYFLPRLVGLAAAKDLAFSGRLVGAEEAAELGLVQEVYPKADFDRRCRERIKDVAAGPTRALAETKQLLNGSFERSLEEALSAEYDAQTDLRGTSDHREGLDAFLDGRKPDFRGK